MSGPAMTRAPVVFLVDVDNTLLDNDRIQADLRRHLEREFGAPSRDRYWAILGALFVELGYRELPRWGPTVILSDGNVVFQPRKVERSGIAEEVDGHVLIYIHKEDSLADVEQRYPAEHYALVDDKPRILAAVKDAWGDRVTTIFPRQGQYARDAKSYRPADVTVERIGDLVTHDVSAFLTLEVHAEGHRIVRIDIRVTCRLEPCMFRLP